MKPTRPRREIFECPHCGADVAVGARVCRECGSDASTGWLDEEEIHYRSENLPDGYRRQADSDALPPLKPRRWMMVVALLVALCLIGLLLAGRW